MTNYARHLEYPASQEVHVVALTALWLPIVVSAVVCFVAGFVLWMVLPHHRSDWKKLPDEDVAMTALGTQAVTPGMYTVPFAASPDAYKDPAWTSRVVEGPTGFLLIVDGKQLLSMGPTLSKNFVLLLVMGLMIAYVGSATLPIGTDYLKVFQVTGSVGIVGYSLGGIPKAIFWGWRWPVVMKEVLDGVVYSLLTAGVFGWLWPG
jgi:hypothetical protein